MEVTAAAVCFGLGILVRFSSSSNKKTCERLRRAILVNDLKGLGELLENKEIKNTVLVRGTVGSTSTVENSCLGVFIEETITLKVESLDKEKMNAFGSVEPESKTITVSGKDSLDKEKKNVGCSVVPERKTITVSRKEVPWYLDDDTARVYVCDYQDAKGFKDTLKKYFSTEPVTTYLKIIGSELLNKRKSFHSDGKEKMLITDVDCRKCQRVLEIGTDLTVVGWAVRDKDGAPMIGQAYQFFSGHIQLDECVAELESESAKSGFLSFWLIALGVFFLGLKISELDESDFA